MIAAPVGPDSCVQCSSTKASTEFHAAPVNPHLCMFQHSSGNISKELQLLYPPTVSLIGPLHFPASENKSYITHDAIP